MRVTDAATRAALERVAATPRLLVALDFDGTLAPLVDEPMAARALPEAAAAVARLADAPDTVVAFVSGRQLDDLVVIAEHTDDSPVHLSGSHGAELRHPRGFTAAHEPTDDASTDAGERADAEALRTDATAAIEGIPGAWIEPKAFGFALHTRLSTAEDAARAAGAIDALMNDRAPGWRRRAGRDVVEFAWRHEGKDTAVAALREAMGATAVLFAGDDVTDEDALASLLPGDLGVRVGAGETVAPVRVGSAAEFAELLHVLADLRAQRSSGSRAERAGDLRPGRAE